MPLDNSLKTAHIFDAIARARQGRTQVVTFVSQSGGSWVYTLQTVIFRRQEVIDPEIPDISGEDPKQKADAIMLVPISISLTGVVYVAYTDTATALAVSNAEKYEIIEATPTGIVPGGTHWVVDLRRLR